MALPPPLSQLTRPVSPPHTHTHTLSLSHTHTHTHTHHARAHTHTLSHTHTRTHTLSLSLPRTHIHTLKHTHTLSLSLSLTHTHTHTLCRELQFSLFVDGLLQEAIQSSLSDFSLDLPTSPPVTGDLLPILFVGGVSDDVTIPTFRGCMRDLTFDFW